MVYSNEGINKEGVMVVGFVGRRVGKLLDSKTSLTGQGITMDY